MGLANRYLLEISEKISRSYDVIARCRNSNMFILNERWTKNHGLTKLFVYVCKHHHHDDRVREAARTTYLIDTET